MHDDYEVSFKIPQKENYKLWVLKFIRHLNYDIRINEFFLNNMDQYVLIQKPNKILKIYNSFKDYLDDETTD